MESREGYSGRILEKLNGIGAHVGDIIRVQRGAEVLEGTLIPKSHATDDEYLILKLKSGYNVGIKDGSEVSIQLLSHGVKPAFKKPPIPSRSGELPKVSVISTGGTIASRVDYRTGGVEPALDAEDLYSVFPELADIANIKTSVLFNVFSENITPQHWKRMAHAVADAVRDGAHGVVICHGTDTMGYTAAALSFILQNLPIPVLLVGSQRSSDRPSSDAASNMVGAVSTAIQAPFAEVVVVMHETISDEALSVHRGTKVRKCHTSSRDAFKSVNSSPIARFHVMEKRFELLNDDVRKRDGAAALTLEDTLDENVALLKFYPGMSPDILESLIDRGVHGVILEGTGLGHVSSSFYRPVERAAKEGLFVGMTSQCLWGRVNMHVYSTGRDLLRLGVTPLEDMLPETALIKLMWVLGRTRNLPEVRSMMTKNIAYEISGRRWQWEEEGRGRLQ